ncbi:MAG: glycosyltransferase [Planctomycetota bacterium]
MRLLVFTTLYPNEAEPVKAAFMRNRVMALRDAGAEVRVVSPVAYFPRLPGCGRWSAMARVPRRTSPDGIPVHHPRTLFTPKVGMRFYGSWMHRLVRPAIERILATDPVDLIDAHYLYPDGLAALRIARDLKLKVTVTARGTDAHTYPRIRAVRPRIREVLEGVDQVFAVSQSLADGLAALVPTQRRIRITPNGVDTDLFHPLDRAAARRKLRLSEKGLILLGIGRLVAVKRWDLAVGVVGELLRDDSGLDVQLYLVGDGDLRGPLQASIDTLGLRDRVHLVGKRPQDELPHWYSAADSLLHVSEREGWPNVLLESLACGTPVAGRALPAYTEIAPSPQTSVLSEDPAPAALAQCVREVLERRWDRDQLVHHARQYSWPQMASRILAELSKVHASSLSP